MNTYDRLRAKIDFSKAFTLPHGAGAALAREYAEEAPGVCDDAGFADFFESPRPMLFPHVIRLLQVGWLVLKHSGALDRGDHGVNVLDVGAGKAELLNILRATPVVKGVRVWYYGFDLDIRKAELFHKLYPDKTRARYDVGDFRKGLPYKDEVFHTIACTEALEHVEKAEGAALLREMWRVLKPGGHLVLSTPDSEHKVSHNISRYHLHEWGHAELLGELQEMGSAGAGWKVLHESWIAVPRASLEKWIPPGAAERIDMNLLRAVLGPASGQRGGLQCLVLRKVSADA